jgi:serine/threonine protein phosphatase PrpC
VKITQSYGDSDTGRKRRRNEDAFVCAPPLFAIADGMGGAQAGEVASGLAAAALNESRAAGGGERRVVELIQEANHRVHERAIHDATTSGMGTTMTVALVEPDGRVAIGHVGDSRAYLLRDGKLEQITDDHTLVAELVRRGELSPAEAEVHPQRSVITRVLGTDPDVDVDAFSVKAQPGDIFLLCSDGLSSMVDSETIEEIVTRNRSNLAQATRALIHAANRGGGEDNITAVLFELGDGAAADGDEPDEQTRELAFDEEDTLHPEDDVAPPPPVEAEPTAAPEPDATPPADDTIVVSADEIPTALRVAAVPEAMEEPPPAKEPEPAEEPAGLGRRLLALAVIFALCAVIVALVWWGLAR